MPIRLTRMTRGARAFAVAWSAFFALNVVLSAALCKQLRPGSPPTAQSSEGDFVGIAGSGQQPGGGHRHLAARTPSGDSRHHEHSKGQETDADCEFCLLTGISDTTVPLALAPPSGTYGQAVPAPAVSAHPAEAQLHQIRAPPAA